MKNTKLASVILAAGRGTRMKSKRSKILHPLAGIPMGAYPVQLARELEADPIVLVIGHDPENVRDTFTGEGVQFTLQAEQLGTGHALLCTENQLRDFAGSLLLLCGDVPLLGAGTVQRLWDQHRSRQAFMTVLTVNLPDPAGYGRIVRQGDDVERIIEDKDASPDEKAITEINTGIYLFEAPKIFELLNQLGNDNAQSEYYLTDTVALARRKGLKVAALAAENPEETQGVNDRIQLARAEAVLRRRINEKLMRGGVTLIDPAATYIDAGVHIGTDTLIYPGAVITGATRIGRDCTIEAGSVISGCRLADGVHIKAGSVLSDSDIGENSQIGPMAHLRPGTILRGDNKIGNFVETKKADIGEHSKASHLTYLGDTEIGKDVNIGCGTITCNYDGLKKHKTIIEDQVFVGSDTQFVAPVIIGRNSLIGAGSTITRDVPPDALAISRAEQKNIEGWRLRKKKKAD
jgi:bifunctional UDP-N-acetylglucosamine pyrophosphorylase/glucosamine-1-phosphate N-acetyltransferase